MSTPILNGVMPPRHPWNGRIYPEDLFLKEVDKYLQKMFMEERIKKLNKLNEKIKSNDKIR